MKKLSFLMCFLLLFGILTACSSSNTSSGGTSTSKSDQKPVYGGTLTIADLNDAKGLDPHKETNAQSFHYIENMYDTLFQYKKGKYGVIEKDLVKDYKISKDGKIYTLHLYNNVKFHNGDPLTSKDVKYSINRIKKMGVRAQQFEAVSSIQTPDKTTVVITLKQAVAPFLTFLANPMNAIVNQKVVDAHGGKLDQTDAGSGPFKLVSWKKDQEMVLEKNKSYFKKGLPYLNKVVFKAIPDDTGRTTAIRNKELNIDLQLSSKDKLLLQKSPGINVKSVTGTYWEYIGLNVTKGPLKNKDVRDAIAWAVDRDALNKQVKFGQATPLTGGPIPPGHAYYANLNTYNKRDVSKAKHLLADAGYPKGFSVTLKVGQTQDQIDAAQVVKAQLKDVGIKVKIQQQEDSVFFNALGKKQFEMTIVGWVGFVDPDEFFYNIFHTGGAYNQQGYSNKKVDQLLDEGRVTMDQTKRKQIYEQAQKLIVEDAPMVFLYANNQSSAMTDNVHGFDVNPTVTTKSLESTWLSK
ncbi:ABC transporter substrate-binding protein [Sporolactobacillus sp. STSJ-5]|uniref:ABC transporter substrate-binding protein n=1 Tax=Sporolactobacillus sp. STSJ-5 TaxID=2965076 RepID=UPI002104D301|nr:ABC transporter substrate-binding protein [Sporolactobacillus sp. STSJ-5]MCQ2009961.1 ABC transporter substrate-binding protein [Sporolactobacillus sp. STSJ-5]